MKQIYKLIACHIALLILLTGSSVSAQATSVGLTNAVSEGATNVRLQFSGSIAEPIGHPAAHFSIEEEGTGKLINVLAMEIEGNDVILRTLPMTARSKYTVTVTNTITASDGSPLDSSKLEAVFAARGQEEPVAEPSVVAPAPAPVSTPASTPVIAPAPIPVSEPTPVPDTTPPEDAGNLVLTKTLQSDGNYTVKASWEESLNSAEDLKSYNVYESDNNGISFVGPTALRATVTSTTIANVPPGSLTVKLTAMDETGNESGGIMKTIILPETGGAALLLSAAGACLYAIRKRRL